MGFPRPTSRLTCDVRTEPGSFRAVLSSSAKEKIMAQVEEAPPVASSAFLAAAPGLRQNPFPEPLGSPGAAPGAAIAAGKPLDVPAPAAAGSRLPGSGLTCGQWVLLDEVQAAPDEAVERIERAGHAVQRRHLDLGVPVGEAEEAAGAGGVALLAGSGMQQCPGQQQPGRPHGSGGGEQRAGGSVSLRAGGGAFPAPDGSLRLGCCSRKPA